MFSPVSAARDECLSDPLRAYESLPYSTTYWPLGFPVTLESNSPDLLRIASGGWTWPAGLSSTAALRLQIGITELEQTACPRAPTIRAQRSLLSIVCDHQTFLTCDLQAGYAFGWLSSATLMYPNFLRYHLLDAAVMSLLTAKHLTPLHAACVSYSGRGLLLHGRSGAGKSTLAYACARKGWTFTSDDATYLLRSSYDLIVRGNCGQLRFRPAARELFPEIANRTLTPRMEGKPSIEVPTRDLPGLAIAPESSIYASVALARGNSTGTWLAPLSPALALAQLEESLFPLPRIRELQRPSLERILRARLFTLHYRDLDRAIECLREFVQDGL